MLMLRQLILTLRHMSSVLMRPGMRLCLSAQRSLRVALLSVFGKASSTSIPCRFGAAWRSSNSQSSQSLVTNLILITINDALLFQYGFSLVSSSSRPLVKTNPPSLFFVGGVSKFAYGPLVIFIDHVSMGIGNLLSKNHRMK